MLGNFSDILKCEVCGGSLQISEKDSLIDYGMFIDTTHINIIDTVDKVVCKHLVYACQSCGSLTKYTFRDIEKALREAVIKKFLLLIAKGQREEHNFLAEKHFVYCNKCQGFDGQGSCPKSIFDTCQIKRFPINEL